MHALPLFQQQDLLDLQTPDRRQHLAKLILNLFDKWQLNREEECLLLGVASRNTVNNYRNGTPLSANRDQIERASHLLGIHKALRLLYPYNKDLVYSWVKAPHTAFNERSPLSVIKDEGIVGMARVRRYLDYSRGR